MQEQNVAKVTFARELKKLMGSRGLGPTHLAKELGISHVAILAYQKGRIPHGDILIQIARYFGVRTDDLLFGPDAERPEPLKHLELRDAQVEVSASQLEEIKRFDPEAFTTIKDVIVTYHRGIKKRKPSSAELSGTVAKALEHAPAAQRLAQESERKQKAGGTSGDKPAPGGDAAKGKR
jgi:transcriptional regulator with XRE-family HTH domain